MAPTRTKRNKKDYKIKENDKLKCKPKKIMNKSLDIKKSKQKVTCGISKCSEGVKKDRNRNVNKEKRKNYPEEAVERAIKAVSEGVSLRVAADTFGVPRSTICNKKKNPATSKSGPPTILSKEEEIEVVNWILFRAERGFPITKCELLDAVQVFLANLKRKTPFTDGRPGRHWYEGFRRRNPQLTIRTAQHLTLVRASVTEEDLRAWFLEQEAYLTRKDLLNIDSSRIFNCDETNIQLCPKSEKVITQKGARSVYKVVDANEKESLTSLFMYSADGTRAPPMVMYAYKDGVPKKILENFPRSWGIGLSENGWMTTESFYEYITNIFYPWLLENQVQLPIILYLDGHSSHITMPLVEFCREKHIELIALFPNATHVMQPLDIAFFHPFKDVWKKTVPKWKVENNVMRLRKEQFAAVLKMALDAFKEEKSTVKNGFRACGLSPFDPNAVDYDVLRKKKKTKFNDCHQPQATRSDVVADVAAPNSQLIQDKELHLKTFEANLANSLLDNFRIAELNGVYPDDTNQKGLFEYWLQIKGSTLDTTVTPKATVVSIVQCNNLLGSGPILIDKTKENEDLVSAPSSGVGGIADTDIFNIENCSQENISIPCNLHLTSAGDSAVSENSLNLYGNSCEIIDLPLEVSGIEQESSVEVWEEFSIENISSNSTIPKSVTADNENSKPSMNSSLENLVQKLGISITEVADYSNELVSSTPNIETAADNPVAKSFANAFLLPAKYLPKKKKMKLAGTGKPKLPSAGTSDEWWLAQKEKEKELALKQEKAAKKKLLQEQKKKLAQEKKKLQEQMNAIQKKIKAEYIA